MNLTVSNTNRILRSGNGPTVEYTGQDPIQVNNATHIISLNSAFSAQFAESGVEAKVDELSSCCEQVHSSISSLETQVSSLSSTIEAVSSELPDTSDFLTKASADTLYQPIGDYLTHDESGAFQPAGDYILRSESGAFQPSGDYLTTGILNTLATKQDIRVTSSFIQGEIDYISGAISANPNRDEISAALENIPEYILSGNSNITATSAQDGKNIRWDLRVAATPVVTDTTIVGESGVYARETQVPGQWQVELTQGAYSAINEVSNKLDKSFSSNFYPMTGNPSGFVVSTELANYQTTAGMTGYATKNDLNNFVVGDNVSGFVISSFQDGSSVGAPSINRKIYTDANANMYFVFSSNDSWAGVHSGSVNAKNIERWNTVSARMSLSSLVSDSNGRITAYGTSAIGAEGYTPTYHYIEV